MRISVLLYFILLSLSFACSDWLKSEDTMIDESLIIGEETKQGRNYYIDSVKSFISWTGSNEETSHYGIVHIKNGLITFKDSTITGGEILIDMTRIEILDLKDSPKDSAELAAFLFSKDMFYVENFPVAKLVIDSVEEIPLSSTQPSRSVQDLSRPSPNYYVFTKITVKGITTSLKFPARIDFRYYNLQSSAEFILKRSDLGIAGIDKTSNNDILLPLVLPESVNIGFDIIAVTR